MKKIIMMLWSIVLVSVLMATPVLAAGATGEISVTPETVEPGGEVTVVFAVQDLGEVSAYGLTYTVPEGMEVTEAKWLIEGAVQDVNLQTNQAVLAYSDDTAVNERTELFSITYRVPEDYAGEASAQVRVTLNVKFHSEDLPDVTASGQIKVGASDPDYLPGDINGDGKVNNRDAARLMQKLAGWDVEYVEAALDVNGDGKVNNRDAARLMQKLAGWDVEIH